MAVAEGIELDGLASTCLSLDSTVVRLAGIVHIVRCRGVLRLVSISRGATGSFVSEAEPGTRHH
jgi:hypothetical protein